MDSYGVNDDDDNNSTCNNLPSQYPGPFRMERQAFYTGGFRFELGEHLVQIFLPLMFTWCSTEVKVMEPLMTLTVGMCRNWSKWNIY